MNLIRLHELFIYDPETGILVRRSTGNPCGTPSSKGYLLVWVDGKMDRVHRVAYVIHTGKQILGVIDHIDHCRTNNRANNLRDIPGALNVMHRKAKPKAGVRVERSGRFTARLRGKHLGTFDTRLQAEYVYRQAQVDAVNAGLYALGCPKGSH